MNDSTQGIQSPMADRARARLAAIPHLQRGRPHVGRDDVARVWTWCNREMATTITTSDRDAASCPDCIAAADDAFESGAFV